MIAMTIVMSLVREDGGASEEEADVNDSEFNS